MPLRPRLPAILGTRWVIAALALTAFLATAAIASTANLDVPLTHAGITTVHVTPKPTATPAATPTPVASPAATDEVPTPGETIPVSEPVGPTPTPDASPTAEATSDPSPYAPAAPNDPLMPAETPIAGDMP
jgi:hypothetical protein